MKDLKELLRSSSYAQMTPKFNSHITCSNVQVGGEHLTLHRKLDTNRTDISQLADQLFENFKAFNKVVLKYWICNDIFDKSLFYFLSSYSIIEVSFTYNAVNQWFRLKYCFCALLHGTPSNGCRFFEHTKVLDTSYCRQFAFESVTSIENFDNVFNVWRK